MSHLSGEPQPQVWLAWMNCHRYAKHLPTQPWRGAMSVPRTLALRRGASGRPGDWQLLQQPVAAPQALRSEHHPHADRTLHDGVVDLLPAGADGRAVEVQFAVDPGTATECGLRLRVGAGENTRVGYDAVRGVVFVDRSASGYKPPDDTLYPQRREVPLPRPATAAAGRPLRLQVLVDRSSVEVFVGDGELCLTEQIFPHDHSRGLQLYAIGGSAHFSGVQAWALAPAHFA